MTLVNEFEWHFFLISIRVTLCIKWRLLSKYRPSDIHTFHYRQHGSLLNKINMKKKDQHDKRVDNSYFYMDMNYSIMNEFYARDMIVECVCASCTLLSPECYDPLRGQQCPDLVLGNELFPLGHHPYVQYTYIQILVAMRKRRRIKPSIILQTNEI
jgi:hypothetical protein